MRIPLNTLSIDNNYIRVGTGENVIVGDNGVLTIDTAGLSNGCPLVNWVSGYDPALVRTVSRSASQIISTGEDRVECYLENAFPETHNPVLGREADLLLDESSGYRITMDCNTIVASYRQNAVAEGDAQIDVSIDTDPDHRGPFYDVSGGWDNGADRCDVLSDGVGDGPIIDQIQRAISNGGDFRLEGLGGPHVLVIPFDVGHGHDDANLRVNTSVSSAQLATLLDPVLTSIEQTLLNAGTLSQQGPNEWVPTGTYAVAQLAPVLTVASPFVASRAVVSLPPLVSVAAPAAVTIYELVDMSVGGGTLFIDGSCVAAGTPVFVSAADFASAQFLTGIGTADQLSIRATDGFGFGPWQSFTITSARPPTSP